MAEKKGLVSLFVFLKLNLKNVFLFFLNRIDDLLFRICFSIVLNGLEDPFSCVDGLIIYVDWFLSDYSDFLLSELHNSFLPKLHNSLLPLLPDYFLPLNISSLLVLRGFVGTRRLTIAPTRQFRKKKMAAGRHVKVDKKGVGKNGAKLYARNFFFSLNYLTYTISLGLTINEIITDKLHMVLDLPRLAACGSRSKSSHNMQHFTEKIHTQNSTRLKACHKWALHN
jgi:hypothetical protein